MGFAKNYLEDNDVHRRHSGTSCAKQTGFAARFDGCRMGAFGTTAGGSSARRAAAQMAAAADCRSDPVPAARRLSRLVT